MDEAYVPDAAALAPAGPEREEVVETLAERTRNGARPPAGPQASDSASILTQNSEARLAANLSASDIQFLIWNQEPEPPSVEELQERITKQFPFLLHRYEPGNKARKPHENPPAVDKSIRARFKPLTPEEEKVLHDSLRTTVESTREQSVIRGLVVLEKRESRWKPLGMDVPADRVGQVETVERVPPLPSAWLLPLDSSAHLSLTKTKSKKIFRLPEFEAMSGCSTCDGKGQVMCPLCRSAEPDECFWCDGSGIRKRKTCDNCHGRKIHACLKCDARGTVDCKDCFGKGQVYVGAFVDIKFRTVSLPPIAVKDLILPGTGQPPTNADEVTQCAKLKMLQTITELSRNQADKNVPSVPVLARCIWHKSVKRTVSIWRPTQVHVPAARKLGKAGKVAKKSHWHTTHSHSDEKEKESGDLHRFFVSSDKDAPVVEISQAAAAAATATTPTPGTTTPTANGYATPNNTSGRILSPSSTSAVNTPAASVANLHSIWRGQEAAVGEGLDGRAPAGPARPAGPAVPAASDALAAPGAPGVAPLAPDAGLLPATPVVQPPALSPSAQMSFTGLPGATSGARSESDAASPEVNLAGVGTAANPASSVRQDVHAQLNQPGMVAV